MQGFPFSSCKYCSPCIPWGSPVGSLSSDWIGTGLCLSIRSSRGALQICLIWVYKHPFPPLRPVAEMHTGANSTREFLSQMSYSYNLGHLDILRLAPTKNT
jgi:hypothetical protein